MSVWPAQPPAQPPTQFTAPTPPPTWPQPATSWQAPAPQAVPYQQANPYAATSLPSVTTPPPPAVDTTKASPFAWIVIVAGIAALGCSLLPFYTVTSTATLDGQAYSSSFTGNAWYGIFGWLSVVLVAIGAIGAIVHLAGAKSRVAGADIAVLFSALGLATAIIARIVYPTIENTNLVAGRTWFSLQKLYGTGYWLCVICAIIAVGAASLTLLDAHREATTAQAETPAPAPAPALAPIPPWTQQWTQPQWTPAPALSPPPASPPSKPYPFSY